MENIFHVIAFDSTHYAMMAEKKLKTKFKIQMMPTPRGITASCGISLKVDGEQLEPILAEMDSWEIDPTMVGVYRIEKLDGKYVPTVIDRRK